MRSSGTKGAKPDVIVVGAGVIGLSCAWRLAEAGCCVRVLERAEPGAGASGASLGALIPANVLRDAPVCRLQRESLGLFAAFCRDLERVSGASGLHERCHRLELFASEGRRVEAAREAERALSQLPWYDGEVGRHDSAAQGPRLPAEPLRPAEPLLPAQSLLPAQPLSDAPVQEVVSPQEAARIIPGLQAELGALYCRATTQVDPVRLIAALRVACEQAGVTLASNAPVDRLLMKGDRVRGVVQAGRALESDRVLVAAGVQSSQLDPLVATCAPVEPAKGQAILLKRSKPGLPCLVRRKSIYVMNRGPDHVAVGATTEHAAGFDTQVTPEAVEKLWQGATAFIPELASATLVRSWAGLRPSSGDLHPYLGPVPGIPDFFVATGHYKIGIALAPITAEILTDCIVTGETPRDLEPFRPRALV